MIPLRDVNPTARFAWVTLALILLNVAVFLLWEPVGSDAGAQPGVLLGWWFVFQLLHGVGGLGIDVNGGVAYWAHVGGFLFGLVAAWLLRGTGRDVAVAA